MYLANTFKNHITDSPFFYYFSYWEFSIILYVKLVAFIITNHCCIYSYSKKYAFTPQLSDRISFITAKNWKQLRCPSTDKWFNKLAYSYKEILLNNKKQTIDVHTTIWLNL